MNRNIMVTVIKSNGTTLAILIRGTYQEEGIEFFTPKEYSQQLAFMSHPAGKRIEPHRHNLVDRHVVQTQEVLVIRRGSLRVDLFDERDEYLESRVLYAGDVILLAAGGHGFEVLEDLEMFEIKQGPYAGDSDKTLIHADSVDLEIVH